MSDGKIDEISSKLGELTAITTSLKELVVSHHGEADKHWDRIEAEIRNVKHDQRGLEQSQLAVGGALTRMGDKLRPLEDLPDAIDDLREKLVDYDEVKAAVAAHDKIISRAVRTASIIISFGLFVGWVVEHFGELIWRFVKAKVTGA